MDLMTDTPADADPPIRWYISGPMAGYPENNFPAFQHACDTALGLGWPVLYFDGYAIHPMSRGGQITPAIDVAFIDLLRGWSLRTFGPAARTRGVVSHIRKELVEILAAPDDASEWADLLILALDGAWRAGHDPADIIVAVRAKIK